MTVWIYVDTHKQVGDKDHLKVFADRMPRGSGSANTIGRAWRSNIRFRAELTRKRAWAPLPAITHFKKLAG
jgi:hypothetical protein